MVFPVEARVHQVKHEGSSPVGQVMPSRHLIGSVLAMQL